MTSRDQAISTEWPQDWSNPDIEPYCPDHSFTGTRWWWNERSESWECSRCIEDDRKLNEAGL